MTTCGRRRGVVGDRPVVRAERDHDVTGLEPERLVAVGQRPEAGRARPRSPRAATRPASRTDHGGSIRHRSRNAPRARGPSSSAASPSIDHRTSGRSRMEERRTTMDRLVRTAVCWSHDRSPRDPPRPGPARRHRRRRPAGRDLLHLGQRRDARPGATSTTARSSSSMQQMNVAIVNPVFMLTFLGAPALAAAAVATTAGERPALGDRRPPCSRSAPWSITRRRQRPAQRRPRRRPVDKIKDLGRRADFETLWVRWNVVRSLTSTGALGLPGLGGAGARWTA